MKLKDIVELYEGDLIVYVVIDNEIYHSCNNEDDLTDYLEWCILSLHQSIQGLVAYVREMK